MYITTIMNKGIDQSTMVFHLLQELAKVMRIFQNEAILCEGVTFTQYCILDHVATRGGRLDLAVLHGLLSVEKSTTTRMVGPLIERGLLVKEKSDLDSRALELILTDKGMDTHEKVWACITGFIDQFLQHIPSHDRKNVVDSLGVFIRSIHKCCAGTGDCCG